MGTFSISKNLSIEKEMAEALERRNSIADVEKQRREWDEGIRDPLLMRKAEKIINNLRGRRFPLDSLAEKHFDIFVNYLVLAAKKKGYRLRSDLMVNPWFLFEKNKTPGLVGWDESR